jgi:ParB/RepB/Spo0J family partition protein
MTRKASPQPAESDAGVLVSTMPTAPEAPRGSFGGLSKFEPAVPLEELVESDANPRKRFDEASMAELEASVREKGVLTPLLARPILGRGTVLYEIASGHRRFRAAKAAGVPHVPVLVRDMTDAEFLEVLVIENDQRVDVHALEEAGGYQALLRLKGYDVAKIAARVGRSPKYVYDRLKLLHLIPAAQKLFLEDRFTAGHAILLARLKPEDQKRAIALRETWAAMDGSGVFTAAHSLPFAEGERDGLKKSDPYALVKATSVREFEAWIQHHVKFDAAAADPMLFPETAEMLEQAEMEKLKVIPITHDYQASGSVRESAAGERIYGGGAWERSDGKAGSKACSSEKVGLVACGPGQGEAFRVCVNKEKCAVHWAAWQKERAARQRQAAGEKKGASKEETSYQATERRRKEQNEIREAAAKRWKVALPQILAAVGAAVKKAPTRAGSHIAELVLGSICEKWGMRSARDAALEHVPAGKTAEDLLRHAAFLVLASQACNEWRGHSEFPKAARAFGVDTRKLLEQFAPVEKVQTSAKPAATKGKKKARR